MYQTIIVGTDGSATADKALDTAASLAAACGARLHVVTAYRAVNAAALAGVGAMGPAVPLSLMTGEDEREAAQITVARAADRLRSTGLTFTASVRPGEAADALLSAAEQLDADLIVVGNRGMTGARRYLLGSVADRVAHHARCSVHIAHTCGRG